MTGPGRRAGPPAGMRSCRAKKAPDVTCSQSARAARGQVTSAAARLWVRMRGGCRGGRGAGLAAAALRPLPSPRTPAPALKGAARRPGAVPGTPPPGSFPGPSALPCPGTPGLAARRLAEGRADRVPREGPFPPARQERATRPAPRSLCSCGACGPESACRGPGPAGRCPAAPRSPSPQLPEAGTWPCTLRGRQSEAQRRESLPGSHIS